MIVNAFIFYNELDLLEIRLNELKDVVDLFVLVESTQTFAGKPKPLFYLLNQERFYDFSHRIQHVVVTDMPHSGANRWAREMWQRDCIRRGLPALTSSDWIMVTDADEIPRADVVARLPAIGKHWQGTGLDWCRLKLDMYYYSYEQRISSEWSIAAHRGHVFTTGAEAHGRQKDCPLYIENGGWHFSYLGSPTDIRTKLESFSHSEYDTDYWKDETRIARAIANDEELFEREAFHIWRVPITYDTHPRYLVDNYERFAQKVKV
jgi:beta-1,4-mannosyl-glycoprotein beta-1,4-N-acetylglucosaminyltransferase